MGVVYYFIKIYGEKKPAIEFKYQFCLIHSVVQGWPTSGSFNAIEWHTSVK